MIHPDSTSAQLRVAAAEAVAELASSPRGLALLHAIANISEEVAGLDGTNTEALTDIFEIFATGRINGSMLEILRPFKSKGGAT